MQVALLEYELMHRFVPGRVYLSSIESIVYMMLRIGSFRIKSLYICRSETGQ